MTLNPSQKIEQNLLIHSNFKKIYLSGNRLLRLVRLDKVLPKPNRIEVLEELRNALKTKKIDLLFKRLDEVQPGVATILREELSPEMGNTASKIQYFLKEMRFLFSSPIRKSQRGNKGPTFLVNPCLGSIHNPETCVIKWSNSHEHASNRVYEEISRLFNMRDSCGFAVPSSAYLNFSQNLFETANSSRESFSQTHSQKLEETFVKIASKSHPGIALNGKYLMLAARISGGNLIDFGRQRYASFHPNQKEIFFRNLGNLAFVDLILGNIDRLIQINLSEESKYILEDALEVNLGNVMICWPPDEEGFTTYAIDNEIHLNLINDLEHRTKYLSFLEEFFSSGADPFQSLVKNIISCFRWALSSQVDDLPGNVQKQRASLRALENDLPKGLLQDSLKKGLVEMAKWFRETFLPLYWELPDSSNLKEHIRRIQPQLLEALEERFQCLKNLEVSYE